MGQTYEIRVSGAVPPEVLDELGATATSTQRASTVLHGITDQAALQGVLDRVTALGLEIVEVRQTTRSELAPVPDDS
jgi:hypothetical protein